MFWRSRHDGRRCLWSRSVLWLENDVQCCPYSDQRILRRRCRLHRLAVSINLIGLNPMKLLVWSGIVQGYAANPVANE
jgi:hypothetical protein